MGPISSPETSIPNHLTRYNNPEDGRMQLRDWFVLNLVFAESMGLLTVARCVFHTSPYRSRVVSSLNGFEVGFFYKKT